MDHRPLAPFPVLVGVEVAAEPGRHAQDGEEAAEDVHPLDALGAAAAAERPPADPAAGGRALERLHLFAPVEEVGRRHRLALPAALGVALPERDEPVGRRIGERREQDGVDDRHDRRHRADAEPEDDDRGGAERRLLAQDAQRPAQVPRGGLEERQAALVAAGLAHLLDAAEVAQSRLARRLRRQATGAVALGLHLEVEAQLLVGLAVADGRLRQRPQPVEEAAQRRPRPPAGHEVRSTWKTAAASRSQLSVSAASPRRPAAVRS